MKSVSVVIPVKNGEGEFLEEGLAAVRREQEATGTEVEIVVIDSGSKDRSIEIAHSYDATVIEIPPEEFGHGKTRNLGAERSSGEVICFLTQDATPAPGWLAAHLEAFELDDDVGASFGPHLARADTSPMISRELEQFFGDFAPEGEPTIQRRGDEPFLSNVNTCYRRECWEQIRFRDINYAEDQAFGRDLLARGFAKVYHPQAAVYHAHDYSPIEFMRRYFDEYRGLRESAGHIEPLNPGDTLKDVRKLVAADREWMRASELGTLERARWSVRSVVHHSGRKLFSALGSRTEKLPEQVERRLSLEGRASEKIDPNRLRLTHVAAHHHTHQYEDILRYYREGPAPLVTVDGSRDHTHIAVVIPPFNRGSGGHGTLFKLLSRLERRGHRVSVWLHDPFGEMAGVNDQELHAQINEYFAPLEGSAHYGLADFDGADLVLATGWQTTYPAAMLPGCGARAYLVQDYEPTFYPTSPENFWAAHSYELGFFCIAASPWLLETVRERHGARGSWFGLGVDHDTYYADEGVERAPMRIAFYARTTTPRRAVPLGILALEELQRRMPELEVVAYGAPIDERATPRLTFPYGHIGVCGPQELATLYRQSRVGVCLSLTNYSLVPQEMLACGLPCVDLAGASAESVFGEDGPVTLSEPNPVALTDALERLLTDDAYWTERSQLGVDFVRTKTWDGATDQVESGIREALSMAQEAPTMELKP